MDEVRRKLGFSSAFTVDCMGRSGGLCLLWDNDVDLSIRSYTTHHIDASISFGGSDQAWRFTGVYGWPSGGEKHQTLNLIQRLSLDPHEAWTRMAVYRWMSVRYSVFDRQWTSVSCSYWMRKPKFTWDYGWDSTDFIQERLDLAFANEKWLEKFPNVAVCHLDQCRSDHTPIKIEFDTEVIEDQSRIPHPYQFEAMWIDDESCPEVVRNAWRNPCNSMVDRGILGRLVEWDFKVFGNVNRELKGIREELKIMGKNGMTGELFGTRRFLEARERELMRREEAMWFQRSKANEFKWGDQNTAFFHKKASGHKKHNNVYKLVDDSGMEWRSFEGKAKVGLDYFQGLFQSDISVAASSASHGMSPCSRRRITVYGAALGQQVNFAKSELSFSRNVNDVQKGEIKSILGVREVEKHDRYLGLPTMILSHSTFKEAALRKAPSYTWRSILFGREALARGLLRTVGNGSSIDIWNDRWIPRPSSFKDAKASTIILPQFSIN
ncbi:hypothetical protein V2J09_000135 [Rumex salicifolius]